MNSQQKDYIKLMVKIKEAITKGLTTNQIIEKFNCTEYQVRKARKELKFEPNEALKQAKKLYDKAIAKGELIIDPKKAYEAMDSYGANVIIKPEGVDFSLDPIIPNLVNDTNKYRKVLFISDIHMPFEDKKAVNTVFNIADDWKPDLIFVGGDAIDCYQISDHEKDLDRRVTLEDEFQALGNFANTLSELSPKVTYLLANHEARIYKMIRQNPALNKLSGLSMRKAANLPSHWNILQDQTHVRIGKLLYLHGNLAMRAGNGSPSAMLNKLRTSCIYGHWHVMGKAFSTDYEGKITAGFANGHLASVEQARYIASPNWQSGVTAIEYSWNMEYYQVYQILINDGNAVFNNHDYWQA